MSWHARLSLHYRREGDETTGHDRHEGPLRVLKRLYPEGPAVCHHVVVHPPGGVVGGDEIEIDLRLDEGAHALVTTPGATRFYRSEGAWARQQARLDLAEGARLEWLPLETIVHRGARAANAVELRLAPGAQALGWDVLALGLPASDEAFDAGCFEQRLELAGSWLERGLIDAADRVLLDGGPGFAGRRVLATAWFAAGSALPTMLRETLLEGAREAAAGDALEPFAGATAPQPDVVLMRVLAERVEPAMALLQRVRAAWRQAAWGLAANPPRVWRT
ncbi:MAG: urease accessory protein UreD [Rubrivivax sp.]